MVTPAGFEPATCPLGGKRFHVIIFNNNILSWYLKYVYVLNITANARLDTENVPAISAALQNQNWPLVIGRAKIGEPMSLVKNMNKRKKAGTSRSKKDSTVSPKAYKDMKAGWPKKGKSKSKWPPNREKLLVERPLLQSHLSGTFNTG